MQKYGPCELCGRHGLIADYGFNKEYVCVDCTLKDNALSEHVSQEMIRRHGKEKVQEMMDDTLGEIVRH